MANYDLVINSTFQPFSFEQYIRPYQLYEQAYKEQEAYLDALNQGANSYTSRAEKEKDAKWAQKYLEYAQDFEKAADRMSKEGLSASTRGSIRGLKTRYFDTVIPVEKAMQRQLELAKMADSANPALRNLYGEMPSIDALIENPTLNRAVYSGSAIENSARELAASSSSRKTQSFLRNYMPFYLQKVNTVGYNKKDMENFRKDISSIPELSRIFKDVESQFGNFEGMSESQKTSLRGEILSGIMKGAMYKENIDYMTDQVALENLRASRARKALKDSKKDLPNNLLDLPEYPLNMKIDTTSQGAELRRVLARKTADFLLKRARDNKVDATQIRRYMDKFRLNAGSKKGQVDYYKLIDHLEKYGVGDFNLIHTDKKANTSSGRQLSITGNALRKYLRDEGFTNENALNIWTSDFTNIPNNIGTTSTKSWKDRTTLDHLMNAFGATNDAVQTSNILDRQGSKIPGKYLISNAFNEALSDTYKTQGRHLALNENTKRNLLSIPINQYGDVDGDYSGIYKVGNLDYKTNKVQAHRTRVKKEDLPLTKDGDIDYKAIEVVKVNGGLLLTWGAGKQGFIPDKNLSNQIQRQILEGDALVQNNLQSMIENQRAVLQQHYGDQLSQGEIDQYLETLKQSYLNKIVNKNASIIARGGAEIDVEKQKVE